MSTLFHLFSWSFYKLGGFNSRQWVNGNYLLTGYSKGLVVPGGDRKLKKVHRCMYEWRIHDSFFFLVTRYDSP